MSIEDFPVRRIKRMPVNVPFDPVTGEPTTDTVAVDLPYLPEGFGTIDGELHSGDSMARVNYDRGYLDGWNAAMSGGKPPSQK